MSTFPKWSLTFAQFMFALADGINCFIHASPPAAHSGQLVGSWLPVDS